MEMSLLGGENWNHLYSGVKSSIVSNGDCIISETKCLSRDRETRGGTFDFSQCS